MASIRWRWRDALRLGLTGLALASVAMAGLTLWSLTVTALALIVLTLGVPLTLLAIGGVRRLADRHRRWVGEFTGVPVPRPYRAGAADGGWFRRFRVIVGDPATWRDLAWLPVNATIGFAIALVPGSLLAATGWYLAQPLVYVVFGDGVIRADYRLFRIDDVASSFYGWLLAAVAFGLLNLTGRPVLRLYAALTRWLLAPTARAELGRRVTELAESRTETIDAQAAELRRIERDLHDGAQARLLALGMSLGMAEKLILTDPDAAIGLIGEAMRSNATALAELRDLVRGIHPPVLADRGLDGAVRAVALSSPVPVDVRTELPGRPPAPVESALYFAIAEAVANLVKHSGASQASIRLAYLDDACAIRVTVSDNGRGGAVVEPGGGLHGIQRRLAAFDAAFTLTSPPGGPTTLTMELPCVLSSEKTSPSSATA